MNANVCQFASLGPIHRPQRKAKWVIPAPQHLCHFFFTAHQRHWWCCQSPAFAGSPTPAGSCGVALRRRVLQRPPVISFFRVCFARLRIFPWHFAVGEPRAFRENCPYPFKNKAPVSHPALSDAPLVNIHPSGSCTVDLSMLQAFIKRIILQQPRNNRTLPNGSCQNLPWRLVLITAALNRPPFTAPRTGNNYTSTSRAPTHWVSREDVRMRAGRRRSTPHFPTNGGDRSYVRQGGPDAPEEWVFIEARLHRHFDGSLFRPPGHWRDWWRMKRTISHRTSVDELKQQGLIRYTEAIPFCERWRGHLDGGRCGNNRSIIACSRRLSWKLSPRHRSRHGASSSVHRPTCGALARRA